MKTVIALLLLLAVAGCGKQAGSVNAGATNTSGSSTESATVTERVRSMTAGKTAAKTITVPASGLIADALAGYAGPLDRAARQRFFKFADHTAMLISANNEAALVADSATLARPIQFALTPFNGWEVSHMRDGAKAQAVYASTLAAAGAYANNVMTDLASKLSADVMKNPDEARKSIVAAYEKLPVDVLKAEWIKALKTAHSARKSIDLSGSGNIHFTADTSDFVGDGKGITLVKGGQTLFGDGYLNGQKIAFALESTLASDIGKTQKIEDRSGTSQGNATDAGVKVGQ